MSNYSNGSLTWNHLNLIEHLNGLYTNSFKNAGLQGLEWNTIEQAILKWKRTFVEYDTVFSTSN